MDINMTFQEVGGQWLQVDSQDPAPPTLADILKELNIVIDDNTQFCKIIRYYDKYTEIIEYRLYGRNITIQRSKNEYI